MYCFYLQLPLGDAVASLAGEGEGGKYLSDFSHVGGQVEVEATAVEVKVERQVEAEEEEGEWGLYGPLSPKEVWWVETTTPVRRKGKKMEGKQEREEVRHTPHQSPHSRLPALCITSLSHHPKSHPKVSFPDCF